MCVVSECAVSNLGAVVLQIDHGSSREAGRVSDLFCEGVIPKLWSSSTSGARADRLRTGVVSQRVSGEACYLGVASLKVVVD